MGEFSWKYSDTGKQMVNGSRHGSYLLVPTEFVNEFGSTHIKEECYNGYGDMGDYDIYELVAYWNKNFIYNNAGHKTKAMLNGELGNAKWYKPFCECVESNLTFNQFKEKFEACGIELRIVGIDIACYTQDNEELENPIKIVENDNLIYNQAYPSESDPNQGWEIYHAETLYPEDITGTIGEWLELDLSELSSEVIDHLQKAYDICCQEL